MKPLLFYTTEQKPKDFEKFKPKKFPCFVLNKDNWDDFSTTCLFQLYLYDEKTTAHKIGDIKILHIDLENTKLSAEFEQLDESFISLGQELKFYELLVELCGQDLTINVLESLRDIAWQPPLAEKFEGKSSFRNALLRFNVAQRARRFGQQVIRQESINENYEFTYSAIIPGAEEATECEFNFDSKAQLPGRLIAIIGRNATGKTQYLSLLASDLVQIGRKSKMALEKRDTKFSPQRPIFTRIITVSYSAFDQFERPKSEHVSYVYCGIRDEKGNLSKRHLLETYKRNLQRIRELSREDDWLYYMQEILGDRSQELADHLKLEIEIERSDISEDLLTILSSGQAILANFITSLVAWMDRDSLVLFDEPETHLHPNAVSSLFHVFNSMLKDYRSYAVVATHSPLVIQEVPSERVRVFEREGRYTTVKTLSVESFGETVSELTRHVFETIETPSYYREVLEKLSKNNSFKEVMKLFNDKLSMNAQSYLLAQYMDSENEETE
ncbi:AAA family ATPase [Methylophaga nitratireducenticrescens]|nr:AAA family ATPase [Methylophaga nitratireducenticrescens]